MSYPLSKVFDLRSIEAAILEYWETHATFQTSIDNRKNGKIYTFYEGPPSANGLPGIHHVMARTVKDIFCRYKTLQGYLVNRKAGWDTHGLPVELQVEKELKITKHDIGKTISVEAYNQKCRETVMRYKSSWENLTKRVGYWVNMDEPYITFDNDYIESLWALLKIIYDKGLLYKGYTVQPYSPAAGTGLSSHEVNLPGCYKTVKDTAITAQFKVIRNEQSNFLFSQAEEELFILAWTTTPWTLPSNCALAVGENIDYVCVQTFNRYTHKPITLILAEALVPNYFDPKHQTTKLEQYQPDHKIIPYQIVKRFKGKALLGLKYEQLMPYVKPRGKAFVVIGADFVTTEDGTGIVHTASIFGADDFRVCKANGIASVLAEDEKGNTYPLVDKQGHFRAEVTDFAGFALKPEYEKEKDIKAKSYLPTDVQIAIKLKRENKAFKVEKYEHNYPHCWRTDKPILYYPLDSWFIKTTAIKDRLVELNQKINWKPASTGSGRFGNWLKNLLDWNLSRSRFWGTPLPIWRTEDGSETICIGSVAELRRGVEAALEAGFMPANSTITRNGKLLENLDLHRPFIDACILVSPTGKPMYREPDVIDVWFDSGAMPFAQWHYPFENQAKFRQNFPADYISEGLDQTRGWFFTLHAIATLIQDEIAFKNVVSTGLVLDQKGHKMSKSKGNTVDPIRILDDYGADVTRWYMVNNGPPWDNLKFNEEHLSEVKRKFFDTLFNTYNFFALYANLDGYSPQTAPVPDDQYRLIDRWIISKLNLLITQVTQSFDNYEPTPATRAIQNFVTDDLSNWYVRLNRKRFWSKDNDSDKIVAYQILEFCLKTVAQLMSPVAVFYADKLFQDLNQNTESVHLSDFPKPNSEAIAESLNFQMNLAQRICSLVHSLRKKSKIKVRQPLQKIIILTDENLTKSDVAPLENIICTEINVKTIAYLDPEAAQTFLIKKIKPNYKVVGKKYGRQVKAIAEALSQLDQTAINKFEKVGTLELQITNQKLTLELEEVVISSVDLEGWLVAQEEPIVLALDLTLNDDLRAEGTARELVNRVQNLRKTIGLKVEHKIRLSIYEPAPALQKALDHFKTYIMEEIQAVELDLKSGEGKHELDINDFSLSCDIEIAEES